LQSVVAGLAALALEMNAWNACAVAGLPPFACDGYWRAGRLRFPREVVTELERYEGADNPALKRAQVNQGTATQLQPSFDELAVVLAEVPEVLDPDKEGVEEADAYVLAVARRLTVAGDDARVVTEEFKTTIAKMPLGSAAGYLRIPSVSIRTMLKFEDILSF
jgi:hypothetical protein